MTSLELKVATLKSRIAELEGNLSQAHETCQKDRKEVLIQQEKNESLSKEVIYL